MAVDEQEERVSVFTMKISGKKFNKHIFAVNVIVLSSRLLAEGGKSLDFTESFSISFVDRHTMEFSKFLMLPAAALLCSQLHCKLSLEGVEIDFWKFYHLSNNHRQ